VKSPGPLSEVSDPIQSGLSSASALSPVAKRTMAKIQAME
jgi:hypothetical protein